MKYCPSCGAELPHNAHFCGHCGYTLDATTILTRPKGKRRSFGANIKPADVSIADAHVAIVDSKEPANPPTPAQTVLTEVLTQVDASESEKQYSRSLKATKSQAITWGWFPVLSLTSAFGILLVALAYESGRVAAKWADPLFWFGLIVIFIPVVWRFLSSKVTKRESIAILVMLCLALYFVTILSYPIYFASYDAFSHWRTVDDIIASGHLFHENPLLPISPYYPGLEIVTDAVTNLTGLSIFTTGLLIIGVGRVVFVLALYLFFKHISGSGRVAGIAALLYMSNAGLFFDQQFAYESLALPLAMVVLFAITFRYNISASRHRKALTLVICLGLGAVVVTHHLTTYALVLFLLVWAAISLYLNRYRKDRASPGWIALFALVLTITWTIYTGDIVVNYLAPHFTSISLQIKEILTHQLAPRQLFHSNTGFVTPLWERVATYMSVALILLGLPFGLFQIWRYYRTRAVVLILAATAFGYPASQALRLTPAGGEAGVRATEFLFLGIAFVLAVGITRGRIASTLMRWQPMLILGMIGVIFVGQVIAGEGPTWDRTPGPYLVSADDRSIEPEGINAAIWARSYLGPGHQMGSDRTNTLLMDTYGNELAYTAGSTGIPVEPVFISLEFGSTEEAIMRQDQLQYLVVDHRLSTELPWVGTYFNDDQTQTTSLIPLAALTKFDNIKNVSRVFDSGDIVIYNVSAISNAPPTNIPSSHSKGAG